MDQCCRPPAKFESALYHPCTGLVVANRAEKPQRTILERLSRFLDGSMHDAAVMTRSMFCRVAVGIPDDLPWTHAVVCSGVHTLGHASGDRPETAGTDD